MIGKAELATRLVHRRGKLAFQPDPGVFVRNGHFDVQSSVS